ncbi:MAG: flavin reductase [Rhodobacteraceae bacterium]|nr:flavin reductase [Paracoccaceae bacterium]
MDFDPRDLRTAFGRYMTGVTVVTARAPDGTQIGFTANSFTSVSLDPPLLLVCPGRHLSSFEAFRSVTSFAVSILSEGQEAVANTFARSKGDRFAETDWQADKNGNALILKRAGGFSCQVETCTEAGDHLILLGRVNGYDHADRPGLGYGLGGYFSLTKERQAEAAAQRDTIASVVLEHDNAVWLEQDGTLPSVRLSGPTGAGTALEKHLKERGIAARLGPVYSIYDDKAFTKHIVLRGRLTAKTAALSPRPIDTLGSGPPGPLTDILTRFATEHRHRNFTLYIGSADHGEIHENHGD